MIINKTSFIPHHKKPYELFYRIKIIQTLQSRQLIDAFLPILLSIIIGISFTNKTIKQHQRQRQKNVFFWLSHRKLRFKVDAYIQCMCLYIIKSPDKNVDSTYMNTSECKPKNLSIFDLSIYLCVPRTQWKYYKFIFNILILHQTEFIT